MRNGVVRGMLRRLRRRLSTRCFSSGAKPRRTQSGWHDAERAARTKKYSYRTVRMGRRGSVVLEGNMRRAEEPQAVPTRTVATSRATWARDQMRRLAFCGSAARGCDCALGGCAGTAAGGGCAIGCAFHGAANARARGRGFSTDAPGRGTGDGAARLGDRGGDGPERGADCTRDFNQSSFGC